MKIRPAGAALFHNDWRTDGRTDTETDVMKLTVTLDNFANTPKDEWCEWSGFWNISFPYIKLHKMTWGHYWDTATSILIFITRRRSVFGYTIQTPCGLVTTLESFFYIVRGVGYSYILKVERLCFSEAMVNSCQNTRRHTLNTVFFNRRLEKLAINYFTHWSINNENIDAGYIRFSVHSSGHRTLNWLQVARNWEGGGVVWGKYSSTPLKWCTSYLSKG